MTILRAPSDQRAALPLHRLTIIIFGSLAMVSIFGGIIAIILDARTETNLQIFGAHLTTGHVGVALVITGLIMTFFTVQAVLRSQRDLAALPSDNYIQLSSSDKSKDLQTNNLSLPNKFLISAAVELGYTLYDSLDYFIARIREAGDSQGKFRNNKEIFLVSFNHDGKVTRQLTAKLAESSLWLHFEVRGMVEVRRSNDRFPRGGETIYKHIDHSRLHWSNRSEFEWDGDIAEFLRLGQILLRSIYQCSMAQAPVEEWNKLTEEYLE